MRFAAPGLSGKIAVNSETLPSRAPIRPALSIFVVGAVVGSVRAQLADHVLQRGFRNLGRVGVNLPQLLHLVLEIRGLFHYRSLNLLLSHVSAPFDLRIASRSIQTLNNSFFSSKPRFRSRPFGHSQKYAGQNARAHGHNRFLDAADRYARVR